MINPTPPGSANPNTRTNSDNSDENTEDTRITTSITTSTTNATTSTLSNTTSIESTAICIFPLESGILNNLYNTLNLRKKATNLRNVDPQRYDSEIQSYISQINSLIMTSPEQAKNLSFEKVIKLFKKPFLEIKQNTGAFAKISR